MVKFFRKIRQQLLTANKISKYFLYAIGEIILVMVGILLAFQVNNWNTERLNVEKERELLIDLVENLKIDVHQLKVQIARDSQAVASTNILLEALKIKAPYSDSLDHHFNQPRKVFPLTLTSSGYHTIENYGFNIISSKILRTEIITLFDASYPEIITIVENLNREISPSVGAYFHRHFEVLSNDRSKPNNYELLIRDQLFVNLLSFVKIIKEWTFGLKVDCLNRTQSLKNNIENYLNLNEYK